MTTSKRIKKRPVQPPATREEMEALVGEISALTITQDQRTSEMDERLQNVRAEYEGELIEMRMMLDERMERARLWAMMNQDAFGQRKSIDMVHGTVGFRTGTPKLRTLRGMTWALVLELLQKSRLGAYIRTKTEVDREKLIADREKLDGQLGAVGLEVVQDETFFIDPKREPVEQEGAR